MVDPFPGQGILETHSPKSGWFYSFIPDLISTLLNQSRFRADEMRVWSEMDEGTRFLVMPRKVIDGHILPKPLKGGFLGGFGGFFSRKFREHDYDLGKANCQSFLENYFGIPVQVLQKSGILDSSKTAMIRGNQTEKKVVPIIPFIKSVHENSQKTNTSQEAKDKKILLTNVEFEEIVKKMGERLNAVLNHLPIPFRIFFHPISILLPVAYISLLVFNLIFDCIKLPLVGELINLFVLLAMLGLFLGGLIYKIVPDFLLKYLAKGLKSSMQDWEVMEKPNKV